MWGYFPILLHRRQVDNSAGMGRGCTPESAARQHFPKLPDTCHRIPVAFGELLDVLAPSQRL